MKYLIGIAVASIASIITHMVLKSLNDDSELKLPPFYILFMLFNIVVIITTSLEN